MTATATPTVTPTTATPARAAAIHRPARLPLLLRQLGAELRTNVRSPEFVVPVLALPVVLYLIFGAPRATEAMPGGTLGLYLMTGFGIYGVLNVVLFAIGQAIADERGRGWLRLVRTTPLPAWAYLVTKLALAAALSALVLVAIGLVGAITGVAIPLERWLATSVVLILGGLAIAPLGFLVGFVAPAHGASAIALLILFPLSLASGVFMRVEELPGIVRDISQATPTYHLAELARQASGFGAGAGDALVHVVVIAGWSLLGLALVSGTYRRMVASQFA